MNSIAFRSDSTMFASASNEIHVWDIARGQQIVQLLAGQNTLVTSITFSPDSKVLASGGTDIRLWDIASGKQVEPIFSGSTSWVTNIAFSPDAKMLASLGWDDTVRVWDIAKGQRLGQLLVSGPSIHDIKFIMDGKALAFYAGHQIEIWDVVSG
jgi:WD40 repeat protein